MRKVRVWSEVGHWLKFCSQDRQWKLFILMLYLLHLIPQSLLDCFSINILYSWIIFDCHKFIHNLNIWQGLKFVFIFISKVLAGILINLINSKRQLELSTSHIYTFERTKNQFSRNKKLLFFVICLKSVYVCLTTFFWTILFFFKPVPFS
jgi:hypothetical protein